MSSEQYCPNLKQPEELMFALLGKMHEELHGSLLNRAHNSSLGGLSGQENGGGEKLNSPFSAGLIQIWPMHT